MSATLYCGYYPKKCIDPEIIPYLECDISGLEWHGRHVGKQFYDNCRELAKDIESESCYIFEDSEKLFEFAGRPNTPEDMSDYITYEYNEDKVFIIWSR